MFKSKKAPVPGYKNSSAIFIAEQKANPLRNPLFYKDGRVTARISPLANRRLRDYAKSIMRLPYSLLDDIIEHYISITQRKTNGDKNG